MIRGLTNNAGLKALALLLALGLWVLVAGEQESVRVFTVPLDIITSRARVLSGPAPASVQVRVRGSESILRSLAAEDLSIPLDLSSSVPGEKTVVPLGPASVRGIPAGTAVDTITPNHLVVTVEDLVQREVPVSPRLVGTPAQGWHLADFQADPPRVTIEGPRSEVDRIPAAGTDPILLQGRQEGMTVWTGLSVANPRIRLVEARPVTVTIRIEKDETAK